jgi:glycosyltransferase involved in cell wall biosynthesis
LRSELERLIDRLNLKSQVRLTGFLDNQGVRRELEAARALVLPSFAEGLPVVIMEALALGRPVISTYIAGIPELVEPGQCGWLVPAGAVEPLTAAMAEALSANSAELEQMGRAGAVRAARQHDASAEAEKLADLIANPDTIPQQRTDWHAPLAEALAARSRPPGNGRSAPVVS